VIKCISGCDFIPFDWKNQDDCRFLTDLKNASIIAIDKIQREKIGSNRINEVGNSVENFVLQALCDAGYKAERPKTKNNKRQSLGYPNIVFCDNSKRLTYLECKTFTHRNINTTQRSFYLSATGDFKVTEDAHHFVLSIEIVGEFSNVSSASSWKILDAATLPLNFKMEFNTDNRTMYGKEHNFILAETEENMENDT
jgi:hypothetical protein